jgi:hypothetical protein
VNPPPSTTRLVPRLGHTAATAADPLERVFQAPECARRVEAERVQARRSGRRFSIVVCEAASPHARPAELADLQAVARAALRSSDHVLRVPTGEVVLVLPGTPESGARCATQRVLARAPGSQERVSISTRVHQPEPGYEHRRATTWTSTGPGDRPPAEGIHWDERGVTVLLGQPLPRWKRVHDVMLSLIGLALALPLMALIALGVKLQ